MRWLVVGFTAALIIGAAVACGDGEPAAQTQATPTAPAAEPSPSPAAAETPEPTPTLEPIPSPTPTLTISPQDVAGVETAVREFFDYYNKGNTIVATGYISRDLYCDSDAPSLDTAFAYAALREFEREGSKVGEIRVYPPPEGLYAPEEGEILWADVHETLIDLDTGLPSEPSEFSEGVSTFEFVKQDGDWVFREDPLVIALNRCP